MTRLGKHITRATRSAGTPSRRRLFTNEALQVVFILSVYIMVIAALIAVYSIWASRLS